MFDIFNMSLLLKSSSQNIGLREFKYCPKLHASLVISIPFGRIPCSRLSRGGIVELNVVFAALCSKTYLTPLDTALCSPSSLARRDLRERPNCGSHDGCCRRGGQ